MFIYRKVSPTQRSSLLNIFDQLRKDTGLTSKQLFLFETQQGFYSDHSVGDNLPTGICLSVFCFFFAKMSVTKLKALLVFPTNKGWVLLVTPILLWGMKHITHEYVGRHSGRLQFVISLSADGKSMRRKVCWYEHFSEDFKGVTSSWPDLLDLPNPGLIRRDTLSRLFSNSLICLSSAAG